MLLHILIGLGSSIVVCFLSPSLKYIKIKLN